MRSALCSEHAKLFMLIAKLYKKALFVFKVLMDYEENGISVTLTHSAEKQ